MEQDITIIWKQWLNGQYAQPLNKRQIGILNLWTAFIEEQPDDFDLVEIPDLLGELWDSASIPENDELSCEATADNKPTEGKK